ncbi:hypothetical protein LCGC14_1943850 [marine sediment metagenome]|uniref:6-carboxy-5,6,7,8-tetrahydropterin synthase n=1 Tax=marine sediment metagenome TaxID=412755 RepID=A0A0F9FJF8_9ZZZZ
MVYTISREIGIDAGHRVPTHGSKCKNLHGHRYTIQAICESEDLHEEGEQKDMTLDFGFLKQEMMDVIDLCCDHGVMLWSGDPLLEVLIPNEEQCNKVADFVHQNGWCDVSREWTLSGIGKLYVISVIPTAEALAKHWFERLEKRVAERSNNLAWLAKVQVWETPNCWAAYEKALEPSVLRELLEEERRGEEGLRR